MNDIELNRRELTGDDALRFARESGMLRMVGSHGFTAGVGDLIRFARLVREGWTPPLPKEPRLCLHCHDDITGTQGHFCAGFPNP